LCQWKGVRPTYAAHPRCQAPPPRTHAACQRWTLRGPDLEILGTGSWFRRPGVLEQSKNGLRNGAAASAYGPSMEGAGTRVCGYAIKNSGLTVAVNRQHLHVCVKEPRVKIRISGVARTGQDGRGPYRNTTGEIPQEGVRYPTGSAPRHRLQTRSYNMHMFLDSERT